ncbi:MAG: DUF4296 domain-containing protein [Paludibacter sp.]|nr:DUF4296 domain-containing protein [Paludibacter sp.]
MRTRKHNIIFELLLIGVLIIFMSACNRRPNGVLSKREMVEFLTDLHKLDGTLFVAEMGSANDRENIYYYNAILKKHGITKDQFDSSLVWYSKDPKRFGYMYDDVLANLNKLNEDVKNRKYHPIDSLVLRNSLTDIWQKERKYVLGKDSTPKEIKFSIKNSELKWADTYSLSFLQRIAPGDSSSNKHIKMSIYYTDGTVDSIYTKTYADSLLRRFTLTFAARYQHRIDSLTGTLYGYNEHKGNTILTIDSIKLMRKYDALMQDSIFRKINIIESKAKEKGPLKKNTGKKLPKEIN